MNFSTREASVLAVLHAKRIAEGIEQHTGLGGLGLNKAHMKELHESYKRLVEWIALMEQSNEPK